MNATSKLVKAWESKNAKNAAKAGGISMMALSLAACGGSSTTTTTATDTTTDTTTTTVVSTAGLQFALASTSDVISPNSATATTKSTANDDTFRAATDGDLTSSDIVDGGDGADSLTATIADAAAAVTVKPLLTSVETVTVTFAEADNGNNATTFDMTDSTGITNVSAIIENDVNAVLKFVTASQTVSASKGGATADFTATYTGLSTATDGGADAVTLNVTDIDIASLTIAGVETVTLNAAGKAGDIDTFVADNLETLVITGGVADATSTTETFALGTNAGAANSAIEFDGLDTGETGLINASASTGDVTLEVDDSFDFTATGGAGLLTISNDSAGAGGVTATAAVTITAGAGGVNATIEGGANAASATAMTLVSITGSAAKDTVNIAGVINPTDITATTAVDESKTTNATVTTGDGADAITIDAGVVNVDAGAGDDTITVSTWGAVTTADTIQLGTGDDTVVTSEATLGTAQAATMAMFVGSEVIQTSATAEKSVNTATLGTVTSAVASGTHSATTAVAGNDGSGAASTAGIAAMIFTSANAGGTLTVGALTGQVGSANTGVLAADVGGTGGHGLDINASLDTGNNTVTVTLVDNADITGGVGGAAANDATNVTVGGAGGIAFDANEYETVNLVIAAKDTTKDVVTFQGGIGGVGDSGGASDGGAAGSDFIVGANATINITETIAAKSGATALTVKDHISSIDLGAITGTNVVVNAGTLNGAVTIDSVQGNSTITTGAGADTISAGTGVDTISTGGGDDTIDAQAGADIVTGGDGNDSYVINDGDSAEATYMTIKGFVAAEASWTGSGANDAVSEYQSTGVGGANADILDIAGTIAVDANVAAGTASANSTANVTYGLTNGIITLAGSAAATIDTIGEWIDEVEDITTGTDEVSAFEFAGSTYVFSNQATDQVIMLEGLTGVTGLDTLANSGTIGGEDYIIIL